MGGPINATAFKDAFLAASVTEPTQNVTEKCRWKYSANFVITTWVINSIIELLCIKYRQQMRCQDLKQIKLTDLMLFVVPSKIFRNTVKNRHRLVWEVFHYSRRYCISGWSFFEQQFYRCPNPWGLRKVRAGNSSRELEGESVNDFDNSPIIDRS